MRQRCVRGGAARLPPAEAELAPAAQPHAVVARLVEQRQRRLVGDVAALLQVLQALLVQHFRALDHVRPNAPVVDGGVPEDVAVAVLDDVDSQRIAPRDCWDCPRMAARSQQRSGAWRQVAGCVTSEGLCFVFFLAVDSQPLPW